MFFVSFAHRLLLAFGLFVTATLVLLATKFGFFGEEAQAALAQYWNPTRDFYIQNQAILDRAFAFVGAVGSGVLAALSVHKWWHYAEWNLPRRLDELNEKWKGEVIRSRPDHIPALKHVGSVYLQHARPSPIRRLGLWLIGGEEVEIARHRRRLETYERDIEVLTNNLDRCRTEIATSYLELGYRLSCKQGTGKEALAAFKAPLRYSKGDLDALELSARQAFTLGFHRPALTALRQLAAAASKARKPIRHIRARRFQAEVLHNGAANTDWDMARATVTSAISTLTNEFDQDLDDRNCELFLAYELLARIQIKRERLTAAGTALDEAVSLLNRLHGAFRIGALERTSTLRSALNKAKSDRDNPRVLD